MCTVQVFKAECFYKVVLVVDDIFRCFVVSKLHAVRCLRSRMTCMPIGFQESFNGEEQTMDLSRMNV